MQDGQVWAKLVKGSALTHQQAARVGNRVVFALLGLSLLYCCFAFAQTAPTPKVGATAVVGEATLVIGVVKITHGQGAQTVLEKGGAISVGDQIFTEGAGHVHITFVDGARISVRPQSHLTIEEYSPAGSKAEAGIRFRLEQGTMRSITGSWGEQSRERFRLNTPLAAIGIKGTDFVVKSDSNKTLANVITGAIILAPLTGVPCGNNLVACQGPDLMLTSAMRGQMLELQKGRTLATLVPSFDVLAKPEVVTADLNAAKKNDAGAATSGAVSTNTSTVQNTTVVAAATDQILGSLNHVDLFWGRYPWASPTAGDSFVQAAGAAFAAGMQILTGNGAYTLYRDPGANPVFNPTATSANFQLKNSLASMYMPATYSTEAVQVGQGTLAVNFVNSTFNTSLSMYSPSLGNTTMNSQGIINTTGVMRGTTGDATLTGGFNTSATAAGYAFSKGYSQGTVTGITLWGR